jgi:hypothetical protein
MELRGRFLRALSEYLNYQRIHTSDDKGLFAVVAYVVWKFWSHVHFSNLFMIILTSKLLCREYGMIHRGPGFIAVVWCGSYPTPSPLSRPQEIYAWWRLTRMISMLIIRVRNWCVHWAYASGTDACTERPRQEPMRALSVRARNWCVHWASASGTDACTERMRQELMRALSVRVRNRCVHWAYASGTDACTERPRQELMCALSVRVRNWCVHWASASGTDACTERKRQELMQTLSMRIRN